MILLLSRESIGSVFEGFIDKDDNRALSNRTDIDRRRLPCEQTNIPLENAGKKPV
ncbi:MAG: hypothetical protein ACOY35_03065 [Bacillota bacterium]